MTNKEKWANELIDMCITGGSFAVDKCGVPCKCAEFNCKECTFGKLKSERLSSNTCFTERKYWLEQEYSEPVYLSQVEYDILSALNPIWKYIIRDKDGQLSLFRYEPVRMPELYIWVCPLVDSGEKEHLVLFGMFKPNIFPMIKWTDNKPWSIEKLLSLPVKD